MVFKYLGRNREIDDEYLYFVRGAPLNPCVTLIINLSSKQVLMFEEEGISNIAQLIVIIMLRFPAHALSLAANSIAPA